MRQLTSRDEAMLDWMNVVRLADVDAIRWTLSAYQDDHDGPVSVRRANHWIARIAELGYIGSARPVYRDRQIVWPTHQASGRAAPRLFRQTIRHELAVAVVAARYLSAGYKWTRDRWTLSATDHQADGVAERGQRVDLVEVEFTSKKVARYASIYVDHARRLSADQVSRVVYICSDSVASIVEREADKFLFRDLRHPLIVIRAFDAQGRWVGGVAKLGSS